MDNSNFEKITKQNIAKSGVTKPSIELEDFFQYLDSKVVEKIKNTTITEKERIESNINQYEYDLNGAKNILDYLK